MALLDGCVVLVLSALGTGASAGPKPDPVSDTLGRSFIGTGRMPLASESGKCVVFRRTFPLAATPSKAVLHLFANSRYVVWVNGQYVERGPARFEPLAPEYDSVDIARFLLKGKNAIAVLVVGPLTNGKIAWRPLALTSLVTFGKEAISTDATWKWSDKTRHQAATANWPNVFDIADARNEDGDWTQASYDDSKWSASVPMKGSSEGIQVKIQVDGQSRDLSIPGNTKSSDRAPWWGPLSARRTPLLREALVQPAWAGVFPKELQTGEAISFKFSHLVLAYTKFVVDAEAGTELELTYSPETQYICKAGIQEFITSDTHSIYEGAIRVKKGRATLRKVEFVERLYPFDRAGSFHSNDPLLNKLWTTCVRGLEVTSEDAYVDCSDRERVEWMDCDPPAFDVTRVAMVGPGQAYSDPRLLEAMLRRTAYSIQPEGWVKAHTSSDRFDIHALMEDRGCDWVQGARRYYESCGKTEVIREIWPMIVRQMDYFMARRTTRGLVCAREWVVWGNPVGYQTCEGTALNCFVYRALKDASFLGRKIGKDREASILEFNAAQLLGAINSSLWDENTGTYFGGYYEEEVAKQGPTPRPLPLKVTNHFIEPTRHAALFALDQGVVPADRHERVVRYLFAHRPNENDIMQYYYFFKQQYLLDRPEEDRNVLGTLRREWKDMAESPYEATYEGLHSAGSLAHCYGMFPAYFLSSYVLGVRLDGPVQNKRLLIEPRLGDLTEASGTVVTEFGLVEAAWKKNGAGWEFRLAMPGKVKGRLRLPTTRSEVHVEVDGKSIRPTSTNGRWAEFEIAGKSVTGTWR